MSGDILHGVWLPQPRHLFVWGEAVEPVRRKGRQPKVPLHPFQSPLPALRECLGQLGVEAAELAEHSQTFWLPSAPTAPLPSPELVAGGAIAPPSEAPALSAWQITGLLVPITLALDLLLALRADGGRDQACGADLRCWRVAALLALQLLAGQQLLPCLLRDGYRLRATWLPRPDPQAAQQITALARCLPPVCRAAVDDPADAPAPRALVDDFLAAILDDTMRDAALRRPDAKRSPWLEALLGPDPIVKLTGQAADDLYTSWQAWARQTQLAGDDVFRVTFRLEPPDDPSGPWQLRYLLQATDDPSLLVPAALVWRERGAAFSYLHRRFEQPQERLLAALGYAARCFTPLEASLRQPAPDHAMLSANEAFAFLKESAPLLEHSGFGVLVPAWAAGRGARLQVRATASAASQPNAQSRLGLDRLVDFDWQVTLAGETVDRSEFERLVALKAPLVQLRGQWVLLDPAELQKALAFFERRDPTLALADALRLALDQGAATHDGMPVAEVAAAGWLRELLHKLRDLEQLELLAAPAGLHGQLRHYQVRGYSWLAFLRRFGLGACLADDMGLGKSIMSISLLLHEREQLGVTAPALLVCPTSVIGNWLRELQRFAPSLRPMAHRGAERKQGAAFARAAAEHDIVLTSYPLLARDRETLQEVTWSSAILDEAQNIKNPNAKQAQAARGIVARNRIALTGTPVENRLSELWSIMAFLNPGYLGSEAVFRRELARPIERTGDQAARERLRRLTAPFVLRRVKTDPLIISDLPEKIEIKEYCALTPEQATLYQAVVDEALDQIEETESDGSAIARRGQVLAMLMKLKQVCNHPAQFLHDGSAIDGRSGKLLRLGEMLEEVHAVDERALIFTQFAEMGRLLQRHLQQYGDVLYLHGGTPAKERDTMVRRFEAPGGPRVFVLSLKAGGTGLNLVAANHVFHFDRWWNPAVENQATDRAFRIGQTRNVQVHKFICGGTLEEHIDELIESKRALAESVLGADESWLTELSTAQLRDLVALRRDEVAEE